MCIKCAFKIEIALSFFLKKKVDYVNCQNKIKNVLSFLKTFLEMFFKSNKFKTFTSISLTSMQNVFSKKMIIKAYWYSGNE